MADVISLHRHQYVLVTDTQTDRQTDRRTSTQHNMPTLWWELEKPKTILQVFLAKTILQVF